MLNINAGALPEQQDSNFEPFKAQVTCVIDEFTVDTDQKHGLPYLNAKFQVLEGDYKGRILWADFKGLLEGTSDAWNSALGFNVTEMSGGALRSLLEAVGIDNLTDPQQLFGKVTVVDAYKNKKGYQAISKYLRAGAVTTQAAPQQQQQQTQAAPATGATTQQGQKVPW